MTGAEIANDFLRVNKGIKEITFFAGVISWSHPQEPVLSWIEVATLPKNSIPDEIEAQINHLLGNARYFSTCVGCNELNPVGWMNSEQICQSCAERNDGVVH